MKRIRYSKYVPDPAGEMNLEDLLSALSDYLLQSGFQDSMFYEMPEGEQSLDALRQAIEQALLNGDMGVSANQKPDQDIVAVFPGRPETNSVQNRTRLVPDPVPAF